MARVNTINGPFPLWNDPFRSHFTAGHFEIKGLFVLESFPTEKSKPREESEEKTDQRRRFEKKEEEKLS